MRKVICTGTIFAILSLVLYWFLTASVSPYLVPQDDRLSAIPTTPMYVLAVWAKDIGVWIVAAVIMLWISYLICEALNWLFRGKK